jgi:atypical dual specificity phosphatase
MKNFFQRFGAKSTPDNPPNRSQTSDSSAKSTFRWIIDRQLAVGPIPDAALHDQLLNAGFKSILTLCDETEGNLYSEVPKNFNWQRLVLPDSHYEESLIPDHLAKAVGIVHQAITEAAPIYVHCLAGMERSPSVCVSYLCLHQGMEVWEALNWVKQRNARTSLSPSQVQAIQTLVKQVKSAQS